MSSLARRTRKPPSPHRLTDGERAFVAAYVGPCRYNATQSALRAGLAFTVKQANVVGSKLRRRARVARAIDRAIAGHVAGPNEIKAHMSELATAPFDHAAFGPKVIDSKQDPATGKVTNLVVVNPTAKVKALEVLGRWQGLDRDPMTATLDQLTRKLLDRIAALDGGDDSARLKAAVVLDIKAEPQQKQPMLVAVNPLVARPRTPRSRS